LLFDNHSPLYNTGVTHFENVYGNDTYKISKINLWRRNTGLLQRIVNKVSKPKLYFLEINTKKGFKVEHCKNGCTSNSLIKKSNSFAINSSFYSKNFGTIGEIIINGVRKGKASKSSGYFKVINEKAVVGPKSLFNDIQGPIDYSCQAHPSIMKDGVIWNYIIEETKNESYWKQKTYRSLVGVNNDGNICFLFSGNGGLVSIKEMSVIAKNKGMKHATMLDAGAALQYSIKLDHERVSFSSWNNKINLGRTVDKIVRKIIGQRFYSSSPTFITHSSKS